MKRRPEQQLQRAILEYVNYHGFFIRVPTVGIWDEKIKMRRKTTQKGIADIIGIWNRQGFAPVPVAIECKVSPRKQTPEQKEFQQRWELAGGIYILAYNLEDVMKIVK